jgi:adenylate cyclase
MAGIKPPAGETRGTARFPLAVKLSLVVSALLVFSLGAIIFSVWAFVRADLRNTAASDNDSINYRVASAADTVLRQMRANVSLLLGGVQGSSMPVNSKLIRFFFSQNPDIAALVSLSSGGAAYTYVNEDFVRSHEINSSMISAFIWLRGKELLGVNEDTLFRGEDLAINDELLLFNAAGDFDGLPVLAARFPYSAGNGSSAAAFVFFSSEELSDYFGSGASTSVLVNSRGDLLIQPADGGVSPRAGGGLPGGGGSFVALRQLASGGASVITSIPDEVVFEGINATTIRNVYFAASVLFISLLMFHFFSNHLTRQLQILNDAAEAIEDGRYHNSIPVKTSDETGILTGTMDSMRLALLNFERFTNKEIARLTRKGLLTTGGSYKRATFFFSDIRSFTAISEKMAPAEVVEFLNEYMELMVACVMVTGGVIDKFIGDAVMAHWGAVRSETAAGGETPLRASVSISADALAAVRAALMMRAALQCFNRGRGGDKKPVIKVGCGINSGKVVAGQIGTDERLEYTVIGDAVSLADRTETFNKLFGTEILITENTMRLSGGRFITEEMPAVTENGKKIRIFAVVNVEDQAETRRLFAELKGVPKIDMTEAGRFVGPQGPRTLKALRSLLDIREPDLTKVKLDERERKFKVQKP